MKGGISESLFSGEKDLERKNYAGFLLDTCHIRTFGRTRTRANARERERAHAGGRTRTRAHGRERGRVFVFHVERASGVSSHRVLSLRYA